MSDLENKEMEAPKKNNKKVIIGAGAGVVVLAGVAFAGWKMTETDPKTAVIDAFKSVYADWDTTPEQEIFGTNEILKAIQETGGETGISVSLVSSTDESAAALAGGGFNLVSKADMVNKVSGGSIGIQYGGMDLANINMYIDSTHVKFAVPEMSSKLFSMNYGEDLAGQLEASPFLGEVFKQSGIETEVLEEYFQYIQKAYDKENRPFDLLALWERYKTGSQAVENLKAAMVVEKAEKQKFTVDGQEANCKGYSVMIPKDAVIAFADTTAQFFMNDETLKKDFIEYLTQVNNLSGMLSAEGEAQTPEEMQAYAWGELAAMLEEAMGNMNESLGDIQMTVYVDKQGRMAAADGKTAITVEGTATEIAFHTELKGGNYLLENATAKIDVKTGEETGAINLVKTGTYDQKTWTDAMTVDIDEIHFMYDSSYDVASGDYHLEFDLKDSEEPLVNVNLDGAYTDVVKGKSFRAVFDTIDVTVADMGNVVLDAEVYIKPLDGAIAVPEGEEFDMIAAGEDEWNAVIMEIYGNVFGLLMQIGGGQ